nr:elongation factor 2 [Tanacetum cinerariifolium]
LSPTKEWTTKNTRPGSCERGFVRPEDIRLTRMVLMKCVMQTWLPAANALLKMMILHLPSTCTAKKYHVENLYEGPSDDVYANVIRECDPNGPLMLYVSKMIPASNESEHFFAFVRVFSCIVSPSMKVFSSFGPVLKIAIFDKNGGVQALILYP